MLTDYIRAAMRYATYEWLEEDGVWYAEIPPLPGVWASAATREELPTELQSVREGWIARG
jgi:predicted RNase H-like HicB family nuclease